MLNNYLLKLSTLRMAGSRLAPRPHKVCMMLAILDLIESGEITENRIEHIRTNDELKRQFTFWFGKLAGPSDNDTPENPYFHLLSEGFWHLKSKSGDDYSETHPSNERSKILGDTQYAYLDAELFEYLKSPFTRIEISQALLSNLPTTMQNDSTSGADFKSWLVLQGITIEYAERYKTCITDDLSRIAESSGVYRLPLIDIESSREFRKIDISIRQVEDFGSSGTEQEAIYSKALDLFGGYLASVYEQEKDLDEIISSPALDETEKKVLTSARRGQGAYRKTLISYWGASCAVTGVRDTRLLIASHIKPWRHSSNAERLDYFNGLLLAPNLDKTFDLGLISFKKDGRIMIAPELSAPERLGINSSMQINLAPQHAKYLEYHRDTYF